MNLLPLLAPRIRICLPRTRQAEQEAATGGEEEQGESAPAAPAAPAAAPAASDKAPSARITKSEDELQQVFDNAVASYERGDFEAAEKRFFAPSLPRIRRM